MSTAKNLRYLNVSDYLESEKKADLRHEYVDGDIFQMAGESRRHNQIASNCLVLFRNKLQNSDCDSYFESVKVRANQTTYYYPDLLVTFDTKNDDDEYIVKFPALIVEVLSPSTASTDKREKLIAYKLIPSLKEYVIIWQDEMRIELHRRREADKWLTLFFTQASDEVEFTSISLVAKLSEIYQGIPFKQ